MNFGYLRSASFKWISRDTLSVDDQAHKVAELNSEDVVPDEGC